MVISQRLSCDILLGSPPHHLDLRTRKGHPVASRGNAHVQPLTMGRHSPPLPLCPQQAHHTFLGQLPSSQWLQRDLHHSSGASLLQDISSRQLTLPATALAE